MSYGLLNVSSGTLENYNEYREATLTISCDVINDVITMKNTFSGTICDGLSISDVKINLYENF